MKRLLILAVAAAALSTSACVTIIDADGSDDRAWHGENAQPFDAARDQCRADNHGRNVEGTFRDCMARKGWTRS